MVSYVAPRVGIALCLLTVACAGTGAAPLAPVGIATTSATATATGPAVPLGVTGSITGTLAQPADPVGTWYVNAGGVRWTLTVTQDAAGGLWGGTVATEDGTPGATLGTVAWDAGSHTVTLAWSVPSGTTWVQAEAQGGVLIGRYARTTESHAPAPTDYTGHVTGWKSEVMDHDPVPRVWEMGMNDGRVARVRIDRAAPGSEHVIGTFKIYGNASGAAGEDIEHDLTGITWDGRQLTFATDDPTAPWTFTGTVTGRLLHGTLMDPACGCAVGATGARAEVLSHGISPRTDPERTAWQTATRMQLARLLMNGGPAPTSSAVTVLGTGEAPVVDPLIAPERDDDPSAPTSYTLSELQWTHTLPDPHGGVDLVRQSHGWVAQPIAPPPPGGYPVVIAVNGHGGSAWQTMDPGSMYWYGDGYARQGYLVVSVDISHRPLADRSALYTDFDEGDDPAHGNGVHPAVTSPGYDSDWEEDGERVWDAMRAVDYVLTRPDVDRTRLLVTGLSMGGEVATLTGALDPRVEGIVAAGYSPDLGVVELHGNHPCWQWLHGDVREYVDVSDYHALASPRTLVVETGISDGTYSDLATPFAADKQVMRRSREAYVGTHGRIVHYLHPGQHTYRVGDPAADSGVERGVTVPAFIAPSVMDLLDWQTDATVAQRRATLFQITGWRLTR